MRCYKILMLLVFLAFLEGCSSYRIRSNSPEKKPPPKASAATAENLLPDYIAFPPANSPAFIYGTGTGNSLSQAKETARNEIIQFFRVYIENEFSNYMQSLEINNREYYKSYISNKLAALSHLSIPGISFQTTDRIGNVYYALASLDRAEFENYQAGIIQKIYSLINQADAEDNPGTKLQLYYQSAALLAKIVMPVESGSEPGFSSIFTKINDIYKQIDISSKFRDYSKFTEYQNLIIELKAKGLPLSGIPILIADNSFYADDNGCYYLQNNRKHPYDLLIKIDAAEIVLPAELSGKEIDEARKIIKSLCFFQKNLHIIPPLKLKAFIDTEHYIDHHSSSNFQLENMIKQHLLNIGIHLGDDRADANLIISASSEVFESSYNEYLGYCYKAGGTIRISGEQREAIIIELNDQNTYEKTKAFDKKPQKAAQKAAESLNALLVKELKKINFSDK
jgi:hypothetical protein